MPTRLQMSEATMVMKWAGVQFQPLISPKSLPE